ncbi:MAG: amidohydrolase family protein, partial [Endomicrobia bacterium]|nr:amidohydrolase family protein [Endomicrobiia bacterium]
MNTEFLIIENTMVVNYRELKTNYDIVCKNGKIIEVARHNLTRNKMIKKYKQPAIIKAKNFYVLPGFINIHTHGVDMFNIMDATNESVINMAKETVKYGVTSFLPTIMTSHIDRMTTVAEVIKSVNSYIKCNTNFAEIIGAHFEGPFINPLRCGAQDKNLICQPTDENIKNLYNKNKDVIKIITIAPELQGGLQAIKFFSERD